MSVDPAKKIEAEEQKNCRQYQSDRNARGFHPKVLMGLSVHRSIEPKWPDMAQMMQQVKREGVFSEHQ